MATKLSPCPSPGALEGLLAERLSGPERDGVETHVEGCAPCQEHLARLIARTYCPAAPPGGGREKPDAEPAEDFLRRLRDVSPPMVAPGRSGLPLPGSDEPPPSTAGATADATWFEHGRLGRYDLLGRLGEGGMGVVFKARHAELGKVVALKLLPASMMDEVRVARFKNEIRAIGRLDHPNIVAAHDAGEFRGVHFLVMDFVEGMDLARALERHGRLPVADSCEAVRQAALGLQHAFEHGLIHRDIKPSNLMLARGGRVQVLDLGLARSFADADADALTAKGMMLGTADYLAPEQWEHAHAADTRADIYSLGCTLYHLITGRPPFAGEKYLSVVQKMRAHLETPPPPITQCRPEVPVELAAVLERMLAKDPTDRFQSPAEVAEALRPFTTDSDLARLLGADGVGNAPAEAPCAAAPTPAPGSWETVSERGGRGPRLPGAPSRYVIPVALAAGLSLLLVAASFLWRGFGSSPVPPAKSLEIKEMHVKHLREIGGKVMLLGDLRTSAGAVRQNDKVEVSAELTVPAYYYLIAFNPKSSQAGIVQLCQPEGEDGQGADAVRPDQSMDVRYPHHFVPDAVGLQVFVVAASTKPLPPFRVWRSEADPIPWDGGKDGGAWRWHFDGREFTRFPVDRGRVEPMEDVPESLRKLCEFFKGRAEFEAVQVIAFPVTDARPAKATAPVRELSKADAKLAKELYAKAVAFGRAGKYDEAQGPVREILELRARVLGEDHFETADARREIEALKQLAARPEPDRVEYMKTYVLYDEVKEFWKRALYDDALRPAEQILDIYRRVLGPESTYVAIAANLYGQLLHRAARYADAEEQFRAALRIVLNAVGEDNPGTAAIYGNLALSLEKQDQHDEARRLFRADLDITTRLRGERHPATAVVYSNMAGLLEREALYGDAEGLYRKALDILRTADDEEADKLATACNNLALNLQHQGKYDEVESLYQEALKIRLNGPGEDHPDTGEVYMNLATYREARGDIAAAETFYRETLRTYRKAYGPNHPYTAWALNNLAVNLDKQGKFAEAEQRLGEALAIVRRAPARQSLAVAKMSNNLASCLQGQGKYAAAQELCEKALSVLRDQLGPNHPDVAVAANNVAANLDAQEKYPQAEPHLREALAILERRYGEGHPETAEARDNLGVNLYHQGQFAEAERLFKGALDAQRRALGEGHPSTARTYKLLVVNCCARGDHEQAAALAADAARSFEIAHRRISFAGLDRAGRAAEFSPFPALATVAARAGDPNAAWQALEQNLARGLLDDLSARPLTAAERGREQELLGRLDLLDRKVAALPAGGGADAGGKVVDQLRRQREAAQAEFVRFQTDLGAKYGVTAGEVFALSRIQAQLREDAALLAWVDLSDQDRRVDPKGDHWACLVRHRGAPVWVRLPGSGPSGAWTDQDDRLAVRTRRAFASRPDEPNGGWRELACQLCAQRLAPLEEHLKATDGLPAVRHLIVLPSHQMARIPLEALTDGCTVSYTPSGTMFAWLQEHRPAAGPKPPPRLLALGDPAFRAAPGEGASAPNGDRREVFVPLPGTRHELQGVARLFIKPRLLLGSDASEQNLEQLAASDDLRAFRFLHFATHGVLDNQRPMRSALILAQDQLPDPLQAAQQGKALYEGRLTAERILRGWKLDAELVTLSACESGLGKYAGGEGYLGFSQALFVAGARSLVVSLWQVDDTATALLMARFYENLLGTPEKTVKPLPKAEALAEAKRWLRGLSPDDVKLLTKDLPTRGTRGRIEPRKPAEGPAAVHTYEHPYYWSGFILIGDPQ